jgi:hypothetical protein
MVDEDGPDVAEDFYGHHCYEGNAEEGECGQGPDDALSVGELCSHWSIRLSRVS